jgi:hypothetical protein
VPACLFSTCLHHHHGDFSTSKMTRSCLPLSCRDPRRLPGPRPQHWCTRPQANGVQGSCWLQASNYGKPGTSTTIAVQQIGLKLVNRELHDVPVQGTHSTYGSDAKKKLEPSPGPAAHPGVVSYSWTRAWPSPVEHQPHQARRRQLGREPATTVHNGAGSLRYLPSLRLKLQSYDWCLDAACARGALHFLPRLDWRLDPLHV